MFSVTSNPNLHSLPSRTLSSLSIAIWLEQPFCQKPSKHHKPPSSILHLSSIWKSFQPPFPCCNISFSFCIFKHTTMAAYGLNTLMLCWANTLHHLPFQGQRSICIKLNPSKSHCISHFFKNQVRIQIPSFSMLLYVYERFFHACYNAIWTMLNDLLYWEKSEFLCLWTNKLLLDSHCWSCFDGMWWCICDIGWMMMRLQWSILISVHFKISSSWWWMYVAVVWNPKHFQNSHVYVCFNVD